MAWPGWCQHRRSSVVRASREEADRKLGFQPDSSSLKGRFPAAPGSCEGARGVVGLLGFLRASVTFRTRGERRLEKQPFLGPYWMKQRQGP